MARGSDFARRVLFLGSSFFFAALIGCKTPSTTARTTAESGSLPQEGLASYYGAGLHGHRTANGERFDKEALTAAHRTLAFGTCVSVENKSNGRSVKVRINDRGPYSGNRVIDVSERAARELEMIQSGVTSVRLQPCD